MCFYGDAFLLIFGIEYTNPCEAWRPSCNRGFSLRGKIAKKVRFYTKQLNIKN